MDPDFWHERWRTQDIGFHQEHPQPALVKHWASLGVAAAEAVFVPLAGKSIDMFWLAQQGHRVIGAELSELAVDAFFQARGIEPVVRRAGSFTIKSAGSWELWVGDFFALRAQDFKSVTAAYDRAALVAMPPQMQPRYAAKMAELMPPGSKSLLIGLDYNVPERKGPPFAVPRDTVRQLFEPAFQVELIEARDGLAKSEHLAKSGVTYLEEASYLLARR